MNNNSVIILGFGFSAMITALALKSKNIDVKIINLENKNTRLDPRTTALNLFSKNFLAEINLWQNINEYACPIREIYVADDDCPDMIHFLKKTNIGKKEALSNMGYVIANEDLKNILLSKTKEQIELYSENEAPEINAEDEYCEIILKSNSQKIISPLIIACDGYNSPLRRKYFQTKIDKIYNQNAIICNVKHEYEHENIAVEHFMPSGPFAILPLKEKNYSSIIWTMSDNMAKALLSCPKEEKEFFIKKNMAGFLGDVNIEGDIYNYPLKAYLASDLVFKRIALVSDAAHVIHPLAGQGLNQGIKDIECLTSLIELNEINTESLAYYNKNRYNDNYLMYLITDKLNYIFKSQSIRFPRKLAFKFIEKMPIIKSHLIDYATGKKNLIWN